MPHEPNKAGAFTHPGDGVFVVFDADRSLSVIGGRPAQEKAFGFGAVQIYKGVEQLRETLNRLATVRQVTTVHPIFGTEETVAEVALNTKAEELGVTGVVIDTLSVLFEQTKDGLRKAANMKFLDKRIQAMYGELRDTNLGFLNALATLNCAVVGLIHTDERQDNVGTLFYGPAVQGSTRDLLPRFFDAIAYAIVDVTKDEETGEETRRYLWRVQPNDEYPHARIRAPEGHPWPHGALIEQDFQVLFDYYAEAEVMPKVLIMGPSGSGKSTSLSTLKR